MDQDYKLISHISRIMDNEFKILGISVGLDPIIGIIPGFGDLISTLISLYVFFVALKYKLPGRKLFHMLFNIGFDFIIGIIPFFGDIGDFMFRANKKNVKILHDHLQIFYPQILTEQSKVGQVKAI